MTKVDANWVGLNFDATHIYRSHPHADPVQALAELQPHIFTVRIRDHQVSREPKVGPANAECLVGDPGNRWHPQATGDDLRHHTGDGYHLDLLSKTTIVGIRGHTDDHHHLISRKLCLDPIGKIRCSIQIRLSSEFFMSEIFRTALGKTWRRDIQEQENKLCCY